MNCEHVEELLSAYLDNMLASGEQREVAEHLSSCASCSMLLNEYHHFDTMIAHLPRYSPSPALYLKLFSAAGKIDYTPLPGTYLQGFPELPHTEEPSLRVSQISETSTRPEDVCHFCTVALPANHKSWSTPPQQTEIALRLATFAPTPGASGRTRSLYLLTITLLLLLALGISLIGWQFWVQQTINNNSNSYQLTPPPALEQKQETSRPELLA